VGKKKLINGHECDFLGCRADESAHVVLDREFVQSVREVLILIKGADVILVQSRRKITRGSTHEVFQVFDGVFVTKTKGGYRISRVPSNSWS